MRKFNACAGLFVGVSTKSRSFGVDKMTVERRRKRIEAGNEIKKEEKKEEKKERC